MCSSRFTLDEAAQRLAFLQNVLTTHAPLQLRSSPFRSLHVAVERVENKFRSTGILRASS